VIVMAGLVPAIHVYKSQARVPRAEVVDGRDKLGHDG